MDHDANLEEQRRIRRRILEAGGCDVDDIIRLAELSEAMDEWISKGGALPRAWKTQG